MNLETRGGQLCGVVATHAVDASTRGSGRGTDVDVAGWRGVMAPSWTEEELAEIDGAAGDIASDQVRVHILEGARRKNAAGENAIAEAGGEPLDLRFEGLQHIDIGAVGHVAIRPGNVLPCWGAGGIEEAGLREQDKGLLGVTAVAHGVFGRGDFLKAAAEMHGGCSRAVCGFPRNGAAECVIDFEDTGAVAVFRETAGESRGETVACDPQQLVWGDVAKDGVVVFESGQVFNARGRLDRASERCEVGAESVCDGLRAASRNGPADRMRGCAENHAEGGAQRLVKAEERMRGETSEEGFRAFAAEEVHERFCRKECREAEAREQEGMGREHVQWAEDFSGENGPVFG